MVRIIKKRTKFFYIKNLLNKKNYKSNNKILYLVNNKTLIIYQNS